VPRNVCLLSVIEYDFLPKKATVFGRFLGRKTGHLVPENYDFMSLVWKAAVPIMKVVRLNASRKHSDWAIRAHGVGLAKIYNQIRK
jgi:hypothetical protein